MQAYLNNIVEFINARLFPDVIRKRIMGVAETLSGKPTVIDNNGEGVDVGPDDEFDILVYHRINGIGIKNGTGYGDKPNLINTARMSIIVFGRRDTLRMTNDQCAIYLESMMPQALTVTGFRGTNITMTDISLSSQTVFKEEFSGLDYFIKPEQFIFKLNYTIESTFDRDCFNTCN